jgi:hypothetical protein
VLGGSPADYLKLEDAIIDNKLILRGCESSEGLPSISSF